MRTTLDLDEKLVTEVMKTTKAKTKTEAIHLAMAALIRREKIEQLKALSGKLRISYVRPSQKKADQRRPKTQG